MTENKKLREALQAISHIDDTTNHSVDASAALDRIGQIARQALALPTAAPVVERERFEKWAREQFYSGLACPSDSWSDERKTYNDPAHHMAFCAFRSALSAGDAVDARRLDFIEESARCDPKMDGQHVWWPTSLNKALKGPTLRTAIDAAMRKENT